MTKYDINGKLNVNKSDESAGVIFGVIFWIIVICVALNTCSG